MTKDKFTKWVLEVCSQQYGGKIIDFLGVINE